MRPGITVQHLTLPERRQGLVRCDVTALLAFLPPEAWPDGAGAGDFLHAVFQRAVDFWDHPARDALSAACVESMAGFFENGGEVIHLFAVCVAQPADLLVDAAEGVLAPVLERLRGEEDIGLVVAPDAAWLPCRRGPTGPVRFAGEPLWRTLLAHCREMGNRFVILDAPRGLHGDPLAEWVRDLGQRLHEGGSFGALYYPWLHRRGEEFPPSGAMAGVFARAEREHRPFGVAWPPANLQVRGVTRLAVDLDQAESGVLAEAGLNPIVVQPGRGAVVWGARTLCPVPPFDFVNSRRVVSMITEQLRRDNEWAIFEPNGDALWKVLERDVGVRLEEFWRAGLITGETAHGDYEVRCDEETNPLAEREDGRLNVQVRLRPIGMTEHITIDLRLGEAVG